MNDDPLEDDYLLLSLRISLDSLRSFWERADRGKVVLTMENCAPECIRAGTYAYNYVTNVRRRNDRLRDQCGDGR